MWTEQLHDGGGEVQFTAASMKNYAACPATCVILTMKIAVLHINALTQQQYYGTIWITDWLFHTLICMEVINYTLWI